jgi:SAM-dependent methyltransferase
MTGRIGSHPDEGGGLSDEQWQVAGSAAQVYQRQLVPAIFGPWAPRVLDLAAALAEMARVLVPGGRLVVMVWRSIDHSPGFVVLAEALDRQIGPAAGALMRAPFGLGDEGSLRGLVAGAGFREVGVDRQAGMVRFGSARELVVASGRR